VRDILELGFGESIAGGRREEDEVPSVLYAHLFTPSLRLEVIKERQVDVSARKADTFLHNLPPI
jgi:hypothetical protein